MTRRALMVSCVLGGTLLAALALSQTSYDEGLLAVKKRFAANEIAAIAEPFRGVATSSDLRMLSGLIAKENPEARDTTLTWWTVPPSLVTLRSE